MKGIIGFLGLAPWALVAQTSPYAGSAACKTCHPAIYARWSKTRMANTFWIPKRIRKRFYPIFPNRIRW